IRNTEIAQELSLPPQKLHCSIFLEAAIRSAAHDYRKKKKKNGICVQRALTILLLVASLRLGHGENAASAANLPLTAAKVAALYPMSHRSHMRLPPTAVTPKYFSVTI
ncbi:hypothetical protein B0H11DRAFT_1752118, partial [Mycena galericulata]